MSVFGRLSSTRFVLVASAVVAIQAVRSSIGPDLPGWEVALGVAPNFVAAMGGPFVWLPFDWPAHWRRCACSAAALAGYELAQGAHLVPAHQSFDVSDLVASVLGAGAAAAIGALWVWWS